MSARFFFAVLICLGLMAGSALAAAPTATDLKYAKIAAKALKERKWKRMKTATAKIADPGAAAAMAWLQLTAKRYDPDFGELVAFMDAHPQ